MQKYLIEHEKIDAVISMNEDYELTWVLRVRSQAFIIKNRKMKDKRKSFNICIDERQ